MRLVMWKRRPRVASLVVLLALQVLPGASLAHDVTFPIRVDERFLEAQLLRSVYVDPGRTARVFDDGSGCNSLVLSAPEITAEPGRLRLRTAGEARFGVSAAGRCLLPLSWSGVVELVEEPCLEPDAPTVRFVVVDSRLLDDDGGEPLVTGTLWGWIKRHVHPQLETRIDLQEPVDELRRVLPAFGVATPGSALDGALASVALDGVAVEPGEVEVRVRLRVPDAPPASPAPSDAPVAPLTAEELARWRETLLQWDGFLTFVVKVTGGDTRVTELRDALFGILLDERFALVEALASPDASVDDPVRPLFLRTWTRLAPVLREVGDALPAEQAMRYLSLVSAGDALQALDQLGPESGVEISADGLRRLARIVAPAATEDPLAHGVEVDPALRELFGFGPPLPAPDDNPDVETEPSLDGDVPGASPSASGPEAATPPPEEAAPMAEDAAPTPAPDAAAPMAEDVAPTPAPDATAPMPEDAAPTPAPDAGAPMAEDVAPTPSDEPSFTRWLSLGGVAWAADLPDAAPDREVVKRLNAWAPSRDDVAEYAPLAKQLLDSVTTWLLARHDIDPAHAPVFRALVPATAWKESCWRQYVKRGGKLATLTSPAGAVGIMQVNVAVWRGFYDPSGLKRDIAYNARAGGEILSRYWTDYAVARGELAKGGGVDALARATYAAYNGGPGQLSRYRQKGRPKRERLVDQDFFAKYQRTKSGDALAVVECFGG